MAAIQNDIVGDPDVLVRLKLVKDTNLLPVRNGVRPYAIVLGSWDGSVMNGDIDMIVGFLAVRDTEFIVRYGDHVECSFKLTGGSFQFAFDKKSMLPLCGMVFSRVQIVGDPTAVLVIGASLTSKVRYSLLINPSSWNGIGRTAIVKEGIISV